MRFKAKRSPEGSSSVRGRLGLAVLAAAVAAFFVVPVAQAAAAVGTPTINIVGTGSGEVSSVGGIGAYEGEIEPGVPYSEFGSLWQGEPPIECSYASPGPATGVCEDEVPAEEGTSGIALRAIPASGSEFAGWTLHLVGNETLPGVDCSSTAYCFGLVPPGAGREVTATFTKEPVTPTKLTIARTGEGTIASSPAGIECGVTCEHSFEINETVTLTASPASGWAFNSWSGCLTHVGLTCTVKMDKAKTVKAGFIATPSLSIEKTGSGLGKVKATGISCDENCSKAASSVKAGTSVTVSAAPIKGTESTVVFENGTGNASSCSSSCTFTISEASSVKVKFTAIPTNNLTVKVTGPAAYKGKVTGKGTIKGLTGSAINCGTGCTSQTEAFFGTDEVTLTAATITGYTFAGWSLTAGSNAGTCTGTTTPCIVPTSSAKTLAAEFK